MIDISEQLQLLLEEKPLGHVTDLRVRVEILRVFKIEFKRNAWDEGRGETEKRSTSVQIYDVLKSHFPPRETSDPASQSFHGLY